MNIFLKLKHWQLFTLMFGTLVCNVFVDLDNNIDRYFKYFDLFNIFLLINILWGIGWYYSVGAKLYKTLFKYTNIDNTTFRISILILLIYIVTMIVLNLIQEQDYFEDYNNMALTLCLIALLYSSYFIAKCLKTYELKRTVVFTDFVKEFTLIFLLPIGIWVMQPKINKLFAVK